MESKAWDWDMLGNAESEHTYAVRSSDLRVLSQVSDGVNSCGPHPEDTGRAALNE